MAANDAAPAESRHPEDPSKHIKIQYPHVAAGDRHSYVALTTQSLDAAILARHNPIGHWLQRITLPRAAPNPVWCFNGRSPRAGTGHGISSTGLGTWESRVGSAEGIRRDGGP